MTEREIKWRPGIETVRTWADTAVPQAPDTYYAETVDVCRYALQLERDVRVLLVIAQKLLPLADQAAEHPPGVSNRQLSMLEAVRAEVAEITQAQGARKHEASAVDGARTDGVEGVVATVKNDSRAGWRLYIGDPGPLGNFHICLWRERTEPNGEQFFECMQENGRTMRMPRGSVPIMVRLSEDKLVSLLIDAIVGRAGVATSARSLSPGGAE